MTLDHILRTHAFTKGMDDRRIAALARLVTAVTFEEDELILEEGQRSQCFYLVTEGSVAVELRTSAYAVRIQALAPGQVVGWSALLDDHDTLFQVRARERTRALRMDSVALKTACRVDTTELLKSWNLR